MATLSFALLMGIASMLLAGPLLAAEATLVPIEDRSSSLNYKNYDWRVAAAATAPPKNAAPTLEPKPTSDPRIMLIASEPITWAFEERYNPVHRTEDYLAHVRIADVNVELRCSARNRRMEIRLDLPRAVISNMAHVRWAFDDGAPETAAWTPNFNGRSVRVPSQDVRRFANGLAAFHSLHLDILDEADEAVAYTIPLTKSSRAIERIDELCFF